MCRGLAAAADHRPPRRSCSTPLSLTTPSRPPFATPGEYHRFPTSDGVGAGDAPPDDTIEQGLLVLRRLVR